MFRTIRTLMSLVVLVAVVWWTFTYRIGDSTVAEHLERIGETPEAKGLIDGAKTRIDPVLDEAKQRMIGEYIEAPTAPDPAQASRANNARVVTATAAQSNPQRSPTDDHSGPANQAQREPRGDGDRREGDSDNSVPADDAKPTLANAEDDAKPTLANAAGEPKPTLANAEDVAKPVLAAGEAKPADDAKPETEEVASVLLQPSTPRTSRLLGRP